MTTRRAFIGVIGGAAAWPVVAGAQQAEVLIALDHTIARTE